MSTLAFVATLIVLVPLALTQEPRVQQRVQRLGAQKGFFEGDIQFNTRNRNGVLLKSAKWPQGIVPYSIDMTNYGPENVKMIEEAMREIEKHTCVRFVKHTNEVNNLVIKNSYACFSTGVGMQGGTQYVSLSYPEGGGGCFAHHIVIHELFHAIGLWHEQARYDQENYITIHFEKLAQNDTYSRHQLKMINETESSVYGIPYNYASVMHYDAWSLGDYSAGNFIMEPKQPGMLAVMGFAKSANETDFEKVRRIYDCKGQYPVQPPDQETCADEEGRECEKNTDLCDKDFYMVQSCRKTCGYCDWGQPITATPRPYCENYRSDCDRFINDCGTPEGHWLKRECPLTCGVCDTSKTRPAGPTTPTARPQPGRPTTPNQGGCQDVITYCEDYQHQCGQPGQEWMREACRRTCRFC